MRLNRFQCVLMGLYIISTACLLLFIGPYESLWILMSPYASLSVFISFYGY